MADWNIYKGEGPWDFTPQSNKLAQEDIETTVWVSGQGLVNQPYGHWYKESEVADEGLGLPSIITYDCSGCPSDAQLILQSTGGGSWGTDTLLVAYRGTGNTVAWAVMPVLGSLSGNLIVSPDTKSAVFRTTDTLSPCSSKDAMTVRVVISDRCGSAEIIIPYPEIPPSISGSISYTTDTMHAGELQQLWVTSPEPGVSYSWDILGPGYLENTGSSGSVIYHAPEFPTDCTPVVIGVEACDIILDSVKIAINAWSGAQVAYEVLTSPCDEIFWHMWCGKYSRYDCDGTLSSSDNLCGCGGITYCPGVCAAFSPYRDVRTTEMINGMCCPGGFL